VGERCERDVREALDRREDPCRERRPSTRCQPGAVRARSSATPIIGVPRGRSREMRRREVVHPLGGAAMGGGICLRGERVLGERGPVLSGGAAR
jgi:hypothetical protein